MNVISHTSSDGKTTTISIKGRFDFSLYNDIRKIYRAQSTPSSRYVIDLKNATYMDSSALGMLLQVREYAGNTKESIKIANAGETIKEILNIANFGKLMIID
jgi:anti-anti-sigma factor